MIRIGNAPVSYGAFEVTVGHDENVPGAESVLDAVCAAGYTGIDLGPLGYLGSGNALHEELATRSLLLTGGYVEIDVTDGGSARRGLDELDRICDEFDAVSAGVEKAFLPRPTVAIVAPDGRGADGTGGSADARLYDAVSSAVRLCAARGYETCIHNEVGTQVATQESIVKVIENTDASLCLDTGHLVAAGGNPVAILEEYGARVSHVHLKDARVEAGRPPYTDAMDLWKNDVFCPLGAGTGRVDEVLDTLRARDYSGWIVVEQDLLPDGVASYERAREDQVANRRYLRERGW